MRFVNSIRVGLVAAATFLTVPAASAQTWYAAPAPSNSGGASAYWNNSSQDNKPGSGGICNLGAVLMGVAVNADCNNEVPSGVLPLSSVQQLPGSGTRGAFLAGGAGNSATSFKFNQGFYRFDFYGKIAGSAIQSGGVAPRYGYFEFDGSGNRVLTEIAIAAGTSTTFQTSGNWGFWVGAFRPGASFGNLNVYFSDMTSCTLTVSLTGSCSSAAATQQFALFTGSLSGAPAASGGVVSTSTFDQMWIGAEDNASGGGGAGASDRDYNDVVGSFTNLPEPASFALFGTGLLGVFAVGRRRRK